MESDSITMTRRKPSYVLVTGATGFIGAHVVDNLLNRGLRVRGATRSLQKGEQMKAARPQFASQLDFVQIEDFSQQGDLDEAIDGVDAVIHAASPFSYNVTSNEQELVVPAINGVKSLLSASSKPNSTVRRIVLTSSLGAVVDISANPGPEFTYTADHWNPQTYAESIDSGTSPVLAYLGSKKFAELAAWEFMRNARANDNDKLGFDLVTLCPPSTFGPVVHSVRTASELNASNAILWSIAAGADPLPAAWVSVWIDVRDLAEAHAEALLTPDAGGKRYIPAAPEPFSCEFAAEIMKEEFEWARGKVAGGLGDGGKPQHSYQLDGARVTSELGVSYRRFRETVVDLVTQVSQW